MADPLPKYGGLTVSSMCSLLNRPIIMTGMFRDILARHFQEGTIEAPELKHLIWQKGLETNILIESIHRWRPQLTESRPAIVIKRQSYRNLRKGIGDQAQLNPADRKGDPHFNTFWAGSHSLFCIGGTGAQAELLATEVQRELTEFGPLIRQTMGLHRFQVMEVGEITEMEESTESFFVPVNVGYAYEETWILKHQSPVLSSISLSMILET